MKTEEIHHSRTNQAYILHKTRDGGLSLSCVVAVLLNNSHMVFGTYLHEQSNLMESALYSIAAAAQSGKLNPGP